MCDPLTIGIITAVGSLGATAGSMVLQNNQVSAQNNMNQQWRSFQDTKRKEAQATQERLRQQQQSQRDETMAKLAPDQQQQAQEQESQRLQSDIAADSQIINVDPSNVLADKQFGSDEIKGDFAQRIHNASKEAKDRIKALADVQSYGGSFGGMQTRAKDEIDTLGQNLGIANNMRQGNLSVYGLSKNLAPAQLGPVSDPFSGIGQALAGMSGRAFGAYFAPVNQPLKA